MIYQNIHKKIGILLPYKDIKNGVFNSSLTTNEQVKTNLLNLLLTIKGERYLQPEFGTNLLKYVFEQNTDSLREDIVNEITSAISKWLPYIVIKYIDIFYANQNDFQSNKITIKLDYGISSNNNFTDSITFKINNII